MSTLRAALALALVALTLGACGGALPPERRLTLTVTAAGYEQTTLEARAGEQIFITFQNRDVEAHSLTVELPSGQRTASADAGVDAVLIFPAPAPGTYRLFCVVPGHTEEAVLEVRE